MSLPYLTSAPMVRVWGSGNATYKDYQWDNVKNRYYFVEGPSWLPENQRQSGDFVAADGTIDNEIQGFRLHAVLAFDICADGERPPSVDEAINATGFDFEAYYEMMTALSVKWTVEFFPHHGLVGLASSPSDSYRVIVDGQPDIDRNAGQRVSHFVIRFKGQKVVSGMPPEF